MKNVLKRTAQWLLFVITGGALLITTFGSCVRGLSRDADDDDEMAGSPWLTVRKAACRVDVTIATPLGKLHTVIPR